MEKMPDESVGLGPSVTADGNQKQNQESMSTVLQTGEEARKPYFLPPLSLVTFFSCQKGGRRGHVGSVRIGFLEQHCHREEIAGKSPKISFLKRLLLWKGSFSR